MEVDESKGVNGLTSVYCKLKTVSFLKENMEG
jgi:hypothetical protein